MRPSSRARVWWLPRGVPRSTAARWTYFKFEVAWRTCTVHQGGEVASEAGRIAVVTGGASGIGRKTSELLAERGYTVAIADRNVEGA
ncbi:MAG TPA: hypothetical protein DCP11_15960, partial [Microbacteriaceae bacterium]|nr:hypothetical protein [Microbacteriaceae bacterium]